VKVEIEMKAKVNDSQIDKLLWYFNNETTYLAKKDTYFSFGGIAPKKPKSIIRIRKEEEINAYKLLEVFGGVSNGLNYPNINSILKSFTILFEAKKMLSFDPSKKSSWLTVKVKNTNLEGIETNEETEGQLSEDTEKAFRESMSIANFKPYFTKLKQSFSFYVQNKDKDKNNFEMHAELVSVDGIGPYLEIESVVKEKDAAEARDQIRWFFEYELGITDFDGRSWSDIVEESYNGDKQEDVL